MCVCPFPNRAAICEDPDFWRFQDFKICWLLKRITGFVVVIHVEIAMEKRVAYLHSLPRFTDVEVSHGIRAGRYH